MIKSLRIVIEVAQKRAIISRSNELMNRPLAELYSDSARGKQGMRKENEIAVLKRFESNETGVDLSFDELHRDAQEIVYEIMSHSKTESELVRNLDRSQEFRDAVRSKEVNMQETDTVVRFWHFNHSGK